MEIEGSQLFVILCQQSALRVKYTTHSHTFIQLI